MSESRKPRTSGWGAVTFRRKCFCIWMAVLALTILLVNVADAQRWMVPSGPHYWGVGRNWNPYHYGGGYYRPYYYYGFNRGYGFGRCRGGSCW
jgi:hypothetical protein